MDAKGNLRSGHGASRNFVGVLLDAHLLPIGELALLDGQLPGIAVVAGLVRAHGRLGVFELLLDIANKCAAFLTDKGAKDELRSHFGCAGDGARDGDELAYSLCSEVANAGDLVKQAESGMSISGKGEATDQRQVVERNRKLAGLQARLGRRAQMGVRVEIVALILANQVLDSKPEVGQEAVVLIGNGFGEHFFAVEQVRKVDIERCKLKLLHAMDLLDIVGRLTVRLVARSHH